MRKLREIKQLLREHHYLPRVRQCGDGVISIFPACKLVDPLSEEVQQAYTIQRGTSPGVFLSISGKSEETFLALPEYAHRMFIMANIVRRCRKLNIDAEVIDYEDTHGDGLDTIEDLLNPPEDSEEIAREGILIALVKEANADDFADRFDEIAREQGVFDGYRMIRAICEE